MARPKKQIVDYFSHDTDASQGRTLTILQSKYGNEGYAFWYKMLELLGRSPGHYYNFQNPADWEFLLAKTHVSDDNNAKGILDTLILLGAIDEELYQHGCLWCQNFVDRLDDVYRRRREETPQKPVIVNNNVVSVNIVSTETALLSEETPQSKVNKSKVNNTKGNNNSNVFLLYEQEIGKLTQTISIQLTELQDEYPYSEIAKAVKIAATNNRRSLAYIKGILRKTGKTDAPASILEGLED